MPLKSKRNQTEAKPAQNNEGHLTKWLIKNHPDIFLQYQKEAVADIGREFSLSIVK